MGLEAGNYLDDLVQTNPTSADPRSEGEDHMQLIKKVLKQTFPGMTGRVWRSQTKSAAFDCVVGDNQSIYNVTGAYTASPDPAATLGNGWLAIFHANGGDVTIDPDGAELINGAATLVVPNGSLALVFCTGSAFVAVFLEKAQGILKSLGTAKGSLLVWTASGVVAELAAGANNKLLMADSAQAGGLKWDLPVYSGLNPLPLPKGFLTADNMANGGDATNDIDFGAVVARDSTDVANIIAAAMTKQLDAAWAAGSNAGGRDTGAIANGTWHCFVIRKDSDGSGDFLFSTSATAPTMPAGYTYFRRIGSVLRESATLIPFVQDGDYFRRKVAILDVNTTNPGTSSVTATLSVPTGINVAALFNMTILAGNDIDPTVQVRDLSVTDAAASLTVAPLGIVTTNAVAAAGLAGFASVRATERTNTSAQIAYRASASDAVSIVRIATLGWFDTRGRG